MDPVSSLPAVAALFAAIVTTYLTVRLFGKLPDQGRFTSIDGLRGYLAFFVFLHHSSVWFFYLRTGQWQVPPSNLYTHFGQSSVALFFMVTGFLFFSKLIDGRTGGIDWGRLFVSRLLRLVPLYLFAMFLLFVVVALLSKGVLSEPFPKLVKGVAYWLGFTILGAPNLNGVDPTATIVAGVTWTLPYEWLFYLSLPLLALTVRVTPPFSYIVFGIVSVAGLSIWLRPQAHYLLAFLGGIMAAQLARSETFRRFARRKESSFLILGCIVIEVVNFPTAYGVAPLLLLSTAFVLIACGNTFFGMLSSHVSRTLGAMAYSIYLLHGIILFVAFNYIVGLSGSRALSSITHWVLVIGITPVLILCCYATFRLIENPAMRSVAGVTDWLRSRSRKVP
ncbi:MAG TPA: acyltransferase [Gallionellaceae bacterium]